MPLPGRVAHNRNVIPCPDGGAGSAAGLLAEAAEGAVLVHCVRELLPVHVRDIQVVLDAPQLRGMQRNGGLRLPSSRSTTSTGW